MQWFCLLVLFTLCWLTLDIIDITNPKKIGAYENAMVLFTCVVQLVGIGHYRYH